MAYGCKFIQHTAHTRENSFQQLGNILFTIILFHYSAINILFCTRALLFPLSLAGTQRGPDPGVCRAEPTLESPAALLWAIDLLSCPTQPIYHEWGK